MKTTTVTPQGSSTIHVEDASRLTIGMKVVGSFPNGRYTRSIAENVKHGSTKLILNSVECLGISVFKRQGLFNDSYNWDNAYIVSGSGLQAGTVITKVDRATNTITIQNETFTVMKRGDPITVTGWGRIPRDTVIVDINKETNTITISEETDCSIPRGTVLTFKGST